MQRPVRLAVFAGSPVYYQAPLYRQVAADPRVDFTAIFASNEGATRPSDNGYGRPVEWGVDALEGYESVFLARADRTPGGGGVFSLRDFSIIKVLLRERYDVLWLHGYHTASHVAAAVTQRLLGGALLFREEQTLLSPRARWKGAIKSVGLRPLLRGGRGLFIGTQNRRWFSHWGVPDSRLFHVPYAVDNAGLRLAARELAGSRGQLRAELGIEHEAGPVILAVGRLIPKKQPLHLLEAFRRVRANIRCTLLVVGAGPLEQEMRRKVAAEEIADVVFAGFLDQKHIARAYAAGDLLALVSSHDETWGLVVNEAMNFGLPIVVSDRVGCGVDLVVDGRNGFIVPPHDQDALAQALQALVESKPLRQRFGRASVETINQWTYERAVAGLFRAVAAAVGAQRWSHSG